METENKGLTLELLLKINAAYLMIFGIGLVFGGKLFLELIGHSTTSDGMVNVGMWAGGAVFGIAMLNWTAESFTGENLKPFGMMQFYIWLPLIIINIYTLATGVIDPGMNMVTANLPCVLIIAGLLYMKSKD
ncbi:MAG: hypothetical protein L7S49_06605 [Candidatus Poseidoniaceae archaeon]|nr:hypothetical protein [Candidatus Poseidoniaceae archaeon]